MSLTPGMRLGTYEVLASLGAGGMGEVYRARDTKLGREVALKILPVAFAGDPNRVARFEREAQVLASLNHQNIAHIYGIEEGVVDASVIRALVIELVEGTTLADRLVAGAIPLNETLTIAQQIADALEAAHEKGIIHRDLKPANVMITPTGAVKVLDFGLAAIAQNTSTSGVDVTQSPTLTIAATQAGIILGTAAYMSPEQASGKPVDRRSDIWSFGVILWEMLVGRRLFDGETISHTLADVLRADIDVAALPRETPPAIRDLVRRCLDRDAKSRLRDIGEARVAIQRQLANPAAVAPTSNTPAVRARSSRAGWVAAAVAAAALVILALVHFDEKPAPPPSQMRFQIVAPDQSTIINSIVLSPDGRQYAFEAPSADGRSELWVRAFDAAQARPLTGTEGATAGFFWSPDSRFIAFAVNGFPGRLKKADVMGGPPQTLCEFTGGFRGGDWNAAGMILFASTPGGVWQVDQNGGTPKQLTQISIELRESQHAGPVFLPDGRRFLYYRGSSLSSNAQRPGIYLGSIGVAPDKQDTTRLLAAESNPVYVASPSGGHVLFVRDGILLAQPLDHGVRPAGAAIPLAQDVGNFAFMGWFSVGGNHLAFRTGRAVAARNELAWFDRKGTRLGQVGGPIEMGAGGVQLSPDGKLVTVTRTASRGEMQEAHVWIADVSRGIFSRLNASDGADSAPAITPDGRVVFTSTMNGAVGDLYWTSASGVGKPEPLLTKSPTVKHSNDVSPDGRYLIFDDHAGPSQRQDLYVLPLDSPPGGERKPIPFVVTSADETFGQFSPDGKWIAYASDETGRYEVYVQGFAPDKIPAAAVHKWPISTAGGDKPRWRPDGKELYYIAPDRKMMAVPVKLTPTFEPGVAVPLFETNVTAFNPYDVSADGRFLMNSVSEGTAAAASPITVLLNWQSGLKR